MASKSNRRAHHLFVHTMKDGDRVDTYCVAMHLPETSGQRMRTLTADTPDRDLANEWLRKILSLSGRLLLAKVLIDLDFIATQIKD